MKVLLLVSMLLYCDDGNAVNESERDVVASIFQGYNNEVRPVRNPNTVMNIQIQLQILSLLEVNAAQEYMVATVCINQWWKDEYLTWDPSQFNGITKIKVPSSKIWMPDVMVKSTSLEPKYFTPTQFLSIAYDGTVFISFPFVLTNYCKMRIKDYPFDEQECNIIIGSWAYQKDNLNFEHVLSVDATLPRNENTIWYIAPYVNNTFEFPIIDGSIAQEIHYIQKIRRKSTYYVWVLIAPTFIITALSLAGLHSPFNNQGDREDKVTLGLTTLLTLAVILSIVTVDMPRGTDLPVLGRFVLIEIIMIVVSMAISVLLIFLHERSITRGWPVPNWLLSISGGKHMKVDDKIQIFEKGRTENYTKNVKSKLMHQDMPPSDESVSILRACLLKLNDTHSAVKEYLTLKEEDKTRKHQWLLVFDRSDLIMFMAFQLMHIVSFVTVFYRYFGKFQQ